MPKAIKKKISKPAGKEEDVKTIIHHAREAIARRQKSLLPLLIGSVAAVILIAGFFIYRSHMNTKADNLEYEAYQIYYGLHQRQPLPQADQYQKALEKFREAYDARKSAYPLFYVAACYYDMGKYDDALKTLKELNERFPDDERFVPLSTYKMAVITLRKGDRDGALKLLDSLATSRTDTLRDLALAESAKILTSMGKSEEAGRKSEELRKNFPNSPFARTAQEAPAPATPPPAK
jgi:predicted negative regulator of RcsB-dependent stress response